MHSKKLTATTVGACAVLPYDHTLEDRFTLVTRYDEPFQMYRVVGEDKQKRILIPRNYAFITKENDRRVVGTPVNFVSKFKPRSPEQARVVMETAKRLHDQHSFVICAPTGFGKSVIGCQAIADVGRKTLIVVTKEDLKDSWIQHLHSVLGLKPSEIGQIQGDICDIKGKKVVVAMIQSISKMGKYCSTAFSDFGLAIFDECESKDTEILTEYGWVLFPELKKNVKVAQYDEETESIDFVYPTEYIEKHYTGDLVHITGKNTDILCTPNHLQPYKSISRKKGILKKFKHKKEIDNVKINNAVEFPISGIANGSLEFTDRHRFFIAVQADGNIAKNRVYFNFSKERKIKQLTNICTSLGIELRECKEKRANVKRYSVEKLGASKHFDELIDISNIGEEFIDAFMSELMLWDGYINDGYMYYSTISSRNADFIQAIASIGGYRVSRTVQEDNRSSNYSTIHRLFIKKESWRNACTMSKDYVAYDDKVYCVRVPTGNIVIRRNNKVTITGNCHLVAADVFSNVCFLIPAKIRIGYSATPERKDGKTVVLNAHIGEVEVISEQFTMVPKVIVKYSGVTLPMVHVTKKGVTRECQLPHSPGRIATVSSWLAKHPSRNRDIVEFIKKAHSKGRNILALSDIKKHLILIRELCLSAGIPDKDIAFYIGGLTKDEREKAKVKPVMLGTYHYVSTGTNIPWLDTLVMMTPRADVVQIVGRIVREYPDKKPPVVYDVVDLDSNVLKGYYISRRNWYREIGSEVVRLK